MKQIKQFRYYGERDARNYPANLSYGMLHSGNIFQNVGVVTHLGIQATPGTLFYLNNSESPICVGSTGIYELDLEGIGQIVAIKFNRSSLEEIHNAKGSLLIDIIFEGAGIV